MRQQRELEEIGSLFARWIAEIRVKNALDFYDINKISENLSLKILNLVYGYNLINLNEEKSNFPGLDLGDENENKLAFQITSRVDYKKIKDNLNTFVSEKHNFKDRFTNGIRFLILNQEKVKIGTKNPPNTIYDKFDEKKHIIYESELLGEIEKLYSKDYPCFQKILELLRMEFGDNGTFKSEKGAINAKDFEYIFFSDYSKECEPYYFRRTNEIDGVFSNSLKLKNVWVFGNSGNGKSALAKRNLIQEEILYHYCYLSSYNNLDNSDVIFEDLFSSIYNLYEEKFTNAKIFSNTNLMSKLVEALVTAFKSKDIVIFFDEFFIQNQAIFKDFVLKIISLTELYNQTTGNCRNIKFVISTINSPREFINNYSKSSEYFEFVEISNWDKGDLAALANLINISSGIKMDITEVKVVAESGEATPRIIKEIFRKWLIYKESMSITQVIELVRNEKTA